MKSEKLLYKLYVFVSIFRLDRAQTTMDFEMGWSNGEMETFLLRYSAVCVNVKTKDCSQSRPFQHNLQQYRCHDKVSVPQLSMFIHKFLSWQLCS